MAVLIGGQSENVLFSDGRSHFYFLNDRKKSVFPVSNVCQIIFTLNLETRLKKRPEQYMLSHNVGTVTQGTSRYLYPQNRNHGFNGLIASFAVCNEPDIRARPPTDLTRR